jgi:hypothetical protein
MGSLQSEPTLPLASSAWLPDRPGAELTGYALEGLLGRGGQGEVHGARQLALGRTVAVKRLRPGCDGSDDERRFRAEAAVTALLEHPNIVPVHDLGRDPDGRLQLVMKRVSGRTWSEALLDSRLEVDAHVEILLKVCDAMSFAHSLGVLHRDLKPDNIMIGAHGEVVVMDWGCAVHAGTLPPHPDMPCLRDQDGISGTPAYMAPEQARGDHAACGPWSDVHLLGGILYRILAGRPPRHGPDARTTVLAAAAGETVTDPALHADRRVSLELSSIAMAALHPDPAVRTASVDAFAAALRLYREHREVLQLVNTARREHEAARAGGAGADDAYRRALCTIEQAVRLWPALVAARRLEVAIGLDAARHALVTDACRQAVLLAGAAIAAARGIDDAAAAAEAERIAAAAASREVALRRRDLGMRRLRWIAGVAIGLAVVSLAAGFLWTWRALASSEASLQRAEHEHAARVEAERRTVPALLAQVRELARAGSFGEAQTLARTAAGFAPDDPRPLVAGAAMDIALGHRAAAVTACDAALALQADAQIGELRRLCADSGPATDAALADLLCRMGQPEVAATLDLAGERRVEVATAHLRRHWPSLPAGALRALPDGTLLLTATGSELKLESLEPLRGLPLSSLDISGQDRVHDLGPLAGLPLQTLIARSTGVRDFSVLRSLRLRRLALGWYGSGFSLELVRGMPLELLDATGLGCTDLSAIAGMPLRELRLYGCDRLTDLTALRGMPLGILTLEAPRPGSATLRDLSPLAGLPLSEVNLSWQQGVADLDPLAGAPIRRLILNGTAVDDLRPVISPSLRNLAIGMTPLRDLRPLIGVPLETLDCALQNNADGLEQLLQQPGLRQICGFRREDFPRWLALSRAIEAANPDYAWTATGSFREGRLVELRLLKPLRDLAPLAGLADLRVLQLSGSPSDLRPIAGLRLEELVFTPAPGARGLVELRAMTTLKRIGATPQTLRAAADYWRDAAAVR